MSQRLEISAVRRLLRLAGECRELRDAGADASRHLLGGLAELTRSKVALVITTSDLTPAALPRIDHVDDIGWSTESDRQRVYEFVTRHRLDSDPLSAAVLGRRERIVTMTRADALPSQAWARTVIRNDVHQPSGVDDSLMSLCRESAPGRSRLLVFKRAWGEPAFGTEERELVQLAHGECAWAFEPRPAAARPALAADWEPREREVYALLLTGSSEEEVAATLHLGGRTVRACARAIYAWLGVTNARDLVAAAFPRARRGN